MKRCVPRRVFQSMALDGVGLRYKVLIGRFGLVLGVCLFGHFSVIY